MQTSSSPSLPSGAAEHQLRPPNPCSATAPPSNAPSSGFLCETSSHRLWESNYPRRTNDVLTTKTPALVFLGRRVTQKLQGSCSASCFDPSFLVCFSTAGAQNQPQTAEPPLLLLSSLVGADPPPLHPSCHLRWTGARNTLTGPSGPMLTSEPTAAPRKRLHPRIGPETESRPLSLGKAKPQLF